jgi:hypothetical protein
VKGVFPGIIMFQVTELACVRTYITLRPDNAAFSLF